MNGKLIFFCSLVTAILGGMIGFGAAEISQNQYQSSLYQNLPLKFAMVGAGLGVMVGAGQEAIRELKEQQDQESAERNYSNRHHQA